MVKRRNRSQDIDISIKYRKVRSKTPHQRSTLKIGEVSKIIGIPVVTLRLYENEGLIQSINNSDSRRSTHRRFAQNVFIYLELIRVCRSAGLSIAQIKGLLKLFRGFNLPSKPQMSALKRSIDLIRDQQKKLARIERALHRRLRSPEMEIDALFEEDPDLF